VTVFLNGVSDAPSALQFIRAEENSGGGHALALSEIEQ
jgi:hypothetical protein